MVKLVELVVRESISMKTKIYNCVIIANVIVCTKRSLAILKNENTDRSSED